MSTSNENNVWMVVGLGGTGMSVVRWLAGREASAILVDERDGLDVSEALSHLPDATIHLGSTDAVSLENVHAIIVSPGIPPHHDLLQQAVAAGIPLISDIEIFCRHANAPIVAVTGSNGKSTVISLLEDMCRHAGVNCKAGANLGTPALDLLDDSDDLLYLLELSSFQLERTTSLNALAACVLNLSPDHLDWHGDVEHYRDAKLRIYDDCEFAILNADESQLQPADGSAAIRVEFTLGEPTARQFGVAAVDGVRWLMFGSEQLLQVDACGLRGIHNSANMLAALAIGSAVDLPLSAMRESLKSFHGLQHRHQHVGDFDGVHWINDSKATNIGASLASVAAVEGPVILLLGGRAKGESFEELAIGLPMHVRQCVIYGENRDVLASVLADVGRPFRRVDTLDDAVTVAANEAVRGDTVLLAPAAASHDAYSNYAARGDRFIELVREHCA